MPCVLVSLRLLDPAAPSQGTSLGTHHIHLSALAWYTLPGLPTATPTTLLSAPSFLFLSLSFSFFFFNSGPRGLNSESKHLYLLSISAAPQSMS